MKTKTIPAQAAALMTTKKTTKLISGDTFLTSCGVRIHEILDENGKVIDVHFSKLEHRTRTGDWKT